MRNHEQVMGQKHKEQRLRVMSEEAKARLTAYNEQQTDWYVVCRKCGTELTGSLADMQKHRCPDGA